MADRRTQGDTSTLFVYDPNDKERRWSILIRTRSLIRRDESLNLIDKQRPKRKQDLTFNVQRESIEQFEAFLWVEQRNSRGRISLLLQIEWNRRTSTRRISKIDRENKSNLWTFSTGCRSMTKKRRNDRRFPRKFPSKTKANPRANKS